MTDTFRALCAELTEALDAELDLFETRHSALLDRARAVLAQPEPQGPSDSLVDRVADALMESIKGQAPMARAAIREVAAWLRDHYGGPTASSTALEQEAER
jgi:hypothetical protein